MKTFTNIQVGDYTLKNRVVMAPMTRCRAIDNIPNELMATYYGQRSEAGLIVTEGTSPSPNGLGYPRIPGAFSDAQINGWKGVAKSVHDQGGLIFVQLMHTGRITAEVNLPEGAVSLGPSAIQAAGEIFSETGMVPHDHPGEMTPQDIEFAQNEFVKSAEKLIDVASVDGIELHAANGYLIDQFLNPKSNQRSDEYGGSVENRIRFAIETAKKVSQAIGSGKVGMRISPFGTYNDLLGEYPEMEETYTSLALELKNMNLAYIHVVDQGETFGVTDGRSEKQIALKRAIKKAFEGIVITGGEMSTMESIEELFEEGYDLAYVGRPFISNPDFILRLENNIDLTPVDPDTFFSPGEEGYTDYERYVEPIEN